MFLAYSTNGYTRHTLDAALADISEAGYAGVELLADTPHWSPGFTEAQRLAVRDRLLAAGLRVSNVNANTATCLWPSPPPEPVFEPSLSHADPAVRARRMVCAVAAVELAAATGAPCISVTSGRTQADVPPEEGMTHFATALRTLCERAAEQGVRVGIEYEPALLVERAEEVRALIDGVGHPGLGVNLDVGHALCAGEDPVASIALLAGRIWNVHVEDIRAGKHFHRVPGEGDMPFERIFRALHEAGYTAGVTVELYTCSAFASDAARRAWTHLSPRLAAANRPEPPWPPGHHGP